jgi:hypothetical protein
VLGSQLLSQFFKKGGRDMAKLFFYATCTLQAAAQVHIVVHLSLFVAVLIVMMMISGGER